MSAVSKIIGVFLEGRKWHFAAFLLLITLLTTVMMLFYRPICVYTDPYFHFSRLLVLMEALEEGNFPFYLDYYAIRGYGYFTKAFYSDLFLIPYAIIGNVTSISFAYDSYIFSTTIFTALAMYWAVKRIFKNYFCAFVVAMLYTFSAYRLFQVYYYTMMAEVISFIFIPIVLVGAYEIIKGDYRKWYILALSFSAIIMTHVITTVLLFMILVIFLIIYYKEFIKEKKRILYLFVSGIICFILSAYYLLPMIEQILSNTFYYKTEPFINIRFSLLPFTYIFPGLVNNLPNISSAFTPKMGGLLMMLVFLRLFIYEKSKEMKFIDIAVILSIFFISTNLIFFPWTKFPFNLLSFIQFPWRLLKYTTFFFSLAGGFYLYKLLKTRTRKVIVIITLSILFGLIFRYDSKDYRAMICVNDELITEKSIVNNGCIGAGEYLPSLMPSRSYPFHREDVVIEQSSHQEVFDFTKNKGKIDFMVNSDNSQIFELPLTYYKGYMATLNGIEKNISQSKNGLVEISTSEVGKIKVWYKGTLVQKISPYISILSTLLLCVYIYLVNRRKCSHDAKV